MFEVPIYNIDGKQIDTFKVSGEAFGEQVNVDLVKQAVVTYHANRRQGSAKTKGRSEIAGTMHKMYRQKGTGNARHGTRKVNLMRGGGSTFAKQPRNFTKRFPQKMRQAALRSAILAKIIGQDICIVDDLAVEQPKTAKLAGLMKKLEINRSCILTLAGRDNNVYLSSRNIPDLMVRITEELNAYDVATRQKMIITSEAMKALCGQEK